MSIKEHLQLWLGVTKTRMDLEILAYRVKELDRQLSRITWGGEEHIPVSVVRGHEDQLAELRRILGLHIQYEDVPDPSVIPERPRTITVLRLTPITNNQPRRTKPSKASTPRKGKKPTSNKR